MPKVFISYSHDSDQHKAQVRALADRLRGDGVDCIIDAYVESPPEGWTTWLLNQVTDSDFILVACTEIYKKRAIGKLGKRHGARFESVLMMRQLHEQGMENRRFIPVLLDGADESHIPEPLRDYTPYRMAENDGYEMLYRRLTGQPLTVTPKLGRIRALTTEEPDYADVETKTAADELKAAYETLYEQERQELDTTQIRHRILDLRRKMRENGLKAGDFLADGRYELLRSIGQGGFAQVWKALDRRKHPAQPVAIKVLHQQFCRDETRRERFFRGARQMANLQHSNLVRMLDEAVEDGGYHFFVMEYLPGGDFQKVVREKRLSMEECWDVILQVGRALQHGHKAGIIHRDVKPANILLDKNGNAKLTDFDLVRAAETTGGTRTGAMGTFVYAAPEMLDRPQDAELTVDIYGLGMTAVFALHGKDLPTTVFRDPSAFVKSLEAPESIRDVLAKAIQWEAKDRWPSIEVFCDALESAKSSTDTPEKKPPTAATTTARRQQEPQRAAKLGSSGSPYTALERLLEDQGVTQKGGVESKNLHQVFVRFIGRIKTAAQREVLFQAVAITLPLLEKNPEDFRLIGSMVWALDFFAAQDERGQEFRDQVLAPLRALHRPPELETFNWVSILAGAFMMGSPQGKGHNDEHPQHEVRLDAFRLSRHSITNNQFRLLKPKHRGADNLPVVRIDWYTAYAYASWLGGSLPTEAQWEYAARAGCQKDGKPFDYGNRIGRPTSLRAVGWFRRNSGRTLHAVGQKEPNPWGLVDMYGNVWEWTADWFASYPNKQDHPAAFAAASAGSWRVVRGGSCWDYAGSARAAFRGGWAPGIGSVRLGFRVALPPRLSDLSHKRPGFRGF